MTGNAHLLRLVLMGDSQAEGLQATLRSALEEQGDFQLVSATAIRGISTRAMLDQGKITAIVSSQRPDAVLFVLGGNDTATASYAATLSAAVHAVQNAAPGAHIFWVGPAAASDPETAARHRAVSDAQREFFAGSPDVTWIDARSYTSSGGWGDDGVHFTREAYEEQAHVLATALHHALHPASPLTTAALVVGGVLAMGGAAFIAWRHLS